MNQRLQSCGLICPWKQACVSLYPGCSTPLSHTTSNEWERLISSKHHPVDLSNWVNQHHHLLQQGKSESIQYVRGAVQTTANEQADACGYYDMGLWLKETVSDSLAVTLHIFLAFFRSDISLRNPPPPPCFEKRNVLVKMWERYLHVHNPPVVDSHKTCDSRASCPVLFMPMDQMWRSAAAIQAA